MLVDLYRVRDVALNILNDLVVPVIPKAYG